MTRALEGVAWFDLICSDLCPTHDWSVWEFVGLIAPLWGESQSSMKPSWPWRAHVCTGRSSGVSSVLMDGHIDDIYIRIYSNNGNASSGLPGLYGSTVNSLFAVMLRLLNRRSKIVRTHSSVFFLSGINLEKNILSYIVLYYSLDSLKLNVCTANLNKVSDFIQEKYYLFWNNRN